MATFRFAQRKSLKNRQNVLLDRHLAKNRLLLREISHAEPSALVHWEISDIGPGENDSAAIWPNESNDHVKAGVFPAPFFPEKANDSPLGNFEPDAVHDRAAAIDLDQVFRPQDLTV